MYLNVFKVICFFREVSDRPHEPRRNRFRLRLWAKLHGPFNTSCVTYQEFRRLPAFIFFDKSEWTNWRQRRRSWTILQISPGNIPRIPPDDRSCGYFARTGGPLREHRMRADEVENNKERDLKNES